VPVEDVSLRANPRLKTPSAAIAGVLVIAVRGELDHATLPILGRLLDDAARTSRPVLLDLTELTLIDLSALTALLDARRRFGPRLALAGRHNPALARLPAAATALLLDLWDTPARALAGLALADQARRAAMTARALPAPASSSQPRPTPPG